MEVFYVPEHTQKYGIYKLKTKKQKNYQKKPKQKPNQPITKQQEQKTLKKTP